MSLHSLLLTVAIGWLLAYTHHVHASTRPSSVRLEDNGYTGIAVAINSQVAENKELIDIIKDMFTEGSKYLYEATRKRAYFKKVTILVPKSWTPKPEYGLPGNVTFDYADVIVAPPNPRWAPQQYTKQYQGCGERGTHIHFMEKFLTDPNVEKYYGPLGRMLVHEWGHLRWGLFDEYPDPVGDPDNYQEFYYSPITNQFEGVRCSYNHDGEPLIFYPEQNYYRKCTGNPDVGYEKGCVFYLVRNQIDVSASIMYSSYSLPMIKYFCDADPSDYPSWHNREAPNKHNRLCGRRSNWEILGDHVDFKDGNNLPSDLTEKELIPEFNIVQHKDISVVILMDTSGSMSGEKFNKMISSSANYISSIVNDGSFIGIVQFSSAAVVLKNLTLVTSDADRQSLLDALPPRATGGTGIGQGLLTSVELLAQGGRDPAGGVILLITDGQENVAPYIADVTDNVTRAGVIVDSIAFTQNADTSLPKLSTATGGKTYLYSNEPGSNTLYEAFAATMERGDVSISDKRIQLLGTSWLLPENGNRSAGVFMDGTVGKNTKFVFSWTTEGVQAINVSITRPSGDVIVSSFNGFDVDVNFRIITVSIPEIAEPGSWSISVQNLLRGDEEVIITVSSYPSSDDIEPIIVTSDLSDSTMAFASGEPLIAYAEVRQGFRPVIFANVWATIERPGYYEPIKLRLLDNGAGADVTKNDGVYSRTFTEITGKGYYGVSIEVDNSDGNAIIIESVAFSKARPIVDPDEVFDLPVIGGVEIPAPGTPPQEPTGEPAPEFSRGTSAGSSLVEDLPPGFTPGDDVFPPGRIIDLSVKETSFQNGTVTLGWTATGDDLDTGAASWYQIIRANSIQEWEDDPTPEFHLILNQSSIVEGNLMAPKQFGELEEFVIRVPMPEGSSVVSYAFVLQAFDDGNKTSNFSNAVQAVLREKIPDALPLPVVTVEPVEPPGVVLETWHIALIAVGGVVALAVLFGLSVLIVTKCTGNPNKVHTIPVLPLDGQGVAKEITSNKQPEMGLDNQAMS